jgi:probable H4MPT-linked C1 transfer pathway protein
MTKQLISLDIGGANIKVGTMKKTGSEFTLSSSIHIFPMWRQADELADVLIGIHQSHPAHKAAVTLTAELADAFPTKRNGVIFVLEAVKRAFSGTDVYVLTVDGKLKNIEEALQNPLQAAGANWVASAWAAAQLFQEGILADTGSTTTDIIPFKDGVVATQGRTDPERLTSGELVYTGILRTPCSNLAASVPLRGSFCRVSPEYFAITADVHLILGNIQPKDYQWPTPDGKGKTLECARARLARLVCGDTDLLNDNEINGIAHYLYDKQAQQVTEALYQVLSRMHRPFPLICAGSGTFLLEVAAARVGLETLSLDKVCSAEQARTLPVWSLCMMLAAQLGEEDIFGKLKGDG